jgi:aspartyl-tRNA(Asn)/glutamyl-tRNA(Gln) amidotransferase subunit B
MEYEAIIGLEVHVQLKTLSKMFTRAPYQYGEDPNTLTDPLVMGLPGALPVMNKEAIYKSVQVGRMFGCKIAPVCKWDRKHYFYPDLPKGYQISQFDNPLCVGGFVEIELPGAARNIMGEHKHIELTRIHLEEDVGKLTHTSKESLVDYNRAGACLIEIVTEPVIKNAEEAFAFLTSLRMHMVYANISDCDMEKGQMRCDANISIRPKGETTLGTKVELKNLNTISGVRNGIIHEIERQIQVVKSGGKIDQETRRWNATTGMTESMRKKERAHDYRYFADPDLMPVKLEASLVQELENNLPELPWNKQRRFLTQYDLPYTITSVICPERELSDFFEKAVALSNHPKAVGNLIANELLRELSAAGTNGALPISESKVRPEHIAELVNLVEKGTISKPIAQTVFIEMFQTGQMPRAIVDSKGLSQNSDLGALEAICCDVIAQNPVPVADFKSGNEKAINALKGKVMQLSQGKANPAIVDSTLKRLILVQ